MAVIIGAMVIPPVMAVAPAVRWNHVVAAAGMLAAGVFARRLATASFKWQLTDAVVVVAVVIPVISILTNQQGLRQAVLATAEQSMVLGIPYLVGRYVIRSGDGLRAVAAAVIAATILYAPLCLIESLGRPALATWLFGLEGPNVNATRMLLYYWGPTGYRPYVFTSGFFHLVLLQATGLVLSVGLWLSIRRETGDARWLRSLALIGAVANGVALLALSRSWAGVILPVAAIGLLAALLMTRLRIWLLLACLIVPVYVVLRVTETVPTSPLPIRNADGTEFLAGRGRSVNARTIDNRQVIDAVADRPWLGTGAEYRLPSGTFRISSKYGIDSEVFSTILRAGYLGFGALVVAALLPAAFTVLRVPTSQWLEGNSPLMIAAACVLVAWIINMIPNFGTTALYPLLGGGLVTLTARERPS